MGDTPSLARLVQPALDQQRGGAVHRGTNDGGGQLLDVCAAHFELPIGVADASGGHGLRALRHGRVWPTRVMGWRRRFRPVTWRNRVMVLRSRMGWRLHGRLFLNI